MYKMTVNFESGKQYTYENSITELMTLRIRFKENEERRARLGMEIDKVTSIEMVRV